MPKALIFWTMLAATAALATAGLSETARTGAVSDFTLDNGLEVVVIPDHRTPVVTHMIWYRVGSADETPGKSGLAHFLEHLMFKGRPSTRSAARRMRSRRTIIPRSTSGSRASSSRPSWHSKPIA